MEYDRNDTSLNYGCISSSVILKEQRLWATCYRGSGEVEVVDSSSGG